MNMLLQGPLSTVIKLRVSELKNRTIGTMLKGRGADTVTLTVQELNQWVHSVEQLENRNHQLENAERNRAHTPAEVRLGLIQQLMNRALVFTAKNKAVLKFVPLDDLAHVMDEGRLPVDKHDHYTF